MFSFIRFSSNPSIWNDIATTRPCNMVLLSQTLLQYDNVVSRFGKWLLRAYNIIIYFICIPFPKKHIVLYFSFSGVYRKGKSGPGVLIYTMKADLTAFKIYYRARQRPIPIFEYTELELLLMGYKYIQKYRLALFRHPLPHKQMPNVLKCLLNSGIYEDLVWALALAIAWGNTLRTDEWFIKGNDPRILPPITLIYVL